MLSGQMIYTACGKDKSGAYSVWSKSENITNEECNEIIKLMTYNRPHKASYDLNSEDVLKYFTPKYAFFALSNGKLCIAKTSYVGDVYSVEDMYGGGRDTRSGNFLIHAYVFDTLDKNENPFALFDVNFKTKLEYSEWHDNPAPASLPKVDIKIKSNFDSAEIKRLISKDKDFFVSFIQALLNSYKNDTTVIYSDTEETVRLYYRAVSLFIPKKLYKHFTFSTQYYPQSEYTLLGLGMPPIKIRNISDEFLLTPFNYQQALNEGKYVFNKEKSVCSILKPERYLEDIILSMEHSGLNVAIEKVDRVNKIMEDLNCDENMAIRILSLKTLNFDWFESFDEFKETFKYLCECRYIDNKTIAPSIWKNIIKTRKWGYGSDVSFLIKYVYENVSDDIKKEIIQDYVQNIEAYGVCCNADEREFISEFKNKAPFSWNDFVEYSLTSNDWESICTSNKSFVVSYMYFSIAASRLETDFVAESILIKLLNNSLSSRDLTEVEKYVEILNADGREYKKKIWGAVVLPLSKQTLRSEAEVEFLFAIMRITNDIEQKNIMFDNMIATNGTNPEFIPLYVKCFEKDKFTLASVERELQEKRLYESFFISKQAYQFKITPQINAFILRDYFERFYKLGYDQGIYLIKVKQYIASQPAKMKVYEALRQYEIIRTFKDGYKDILQIVQAIEREIYSVDICSLLEVNKEQLSLMREIDNRLKNNALKTSGIYEILLVALNLSGKNGMNSRFEAVTNKAVYGTLNNAQKSYIAKYFMIQLLTLYSDAKKQLKIDYRQLISTIIVPIINVQEFEQSFITAVSKHGDCIEIVADVMAYAYNNQSNSAVYLRMVMERYVASMQRSEYKSLFKKISRYISEADMVEVQKYIDKFMETHKGFFEALFAKKKNK